MVEGGKVETEAEKSHRGNLPKVGEEEEKETCQQDMKTEEKGEEEQQERLALDPASSQSHFLP